MGRHKKIVEHNISTVAIYLCPVCDSDYEREIDASACCPIERKNMFKCVCGETFDDGDDAINHLCGDGE